MNIRAVGASRFRLIKQTLVECMLLSLAGGVLGIAIAFGTIGFIRVLSPQQDFARFARVTLDFSALIFCFGATGASALLFGLFPAWNLSKTNLVNSLKDGSGRQGTAGPQRQRVQSFLIIAQAILALGVAALLACFLTALRAVRINPVTALRE
jgi:putative ABC transport system permease protein